LKDDGGKRPKGRDEHAADLWGDKMVIFGGFVDGYRSNEIIIYDFKTRKWETYEAGDGPVPCIRAGHSATIYKDSLYVFGGKDDDNMKLSDFWVYDLKTL
jgi:hypothetical protein